MSILNCKKVLDVVHPVENKWCVQICEMVNIVESCKHGEEYTTIPIIENFKFNWKNEIELTVKNNKWLNIFTFGSVRKHLTCFYEHEMNVINKYMKSKNI